MEDDRPGFELALLELAARKCLLRVCVFGIRPFLIVPVSQGNQSSYGPAARWTAGISGRAYSARVLVVGEPRSSDLGWYIAALPALWFFGVVSQRVV